MGAIWQPSALANSASGICDRTGEVREAILGRLADLDGCATVTDDHLSGIDGEIDLSDLEIRSVKVGDFNGLSGLEELTLSQNDLSTLPSGVFDDLSSLNSLNLSYRRSYLLTFKTVAFLVPAFRPSPVGSRLEAR